MFEEFVVGFLGFLMRVSFCLVSVFFSKFQCSKREAFMIDASLLFLLLFSLSYSILSFRSTLEHIFWKARILG